LLDLDYKVLKILYRSSIPLKVGELSKLLELPHSTVGTCIKRLEKGNFVIYKRYQPVILSERGIDLAIELIRHAKLMEILLIQELDLNVEEAHDESEKFNLLLSCNIINKICEKYNHPNKSPCGEVILNSNECYCEEIKKLK
jgi:DtxR family Mn-dependent transcriptional regulator